MAVIPFQKTGGDGPTPTAARLLDGFSIEVTPRTAAKVEDFRALLPAGTRVYVAHIDGTPLDDMVATARRLRAEGFAAMPHIPARSIPAREALRTWLERYRDEADVSEARVIAGARAEPAGPFDSAPQILETGLFEALGFTRLHVAGHPEGSRDIDPDGGTAATDAALLWKQDYARTSAADMAIVTQFAFSAAPVLAWQRRLRDLGVTLPVHLGVAGPTKLQTLLKYAVACGVGPSLSVLQKRARDLTALVRPFTPDRLLEEIAEGCRADPGCLISQIHLFPLGGIRAAAEYAAGGAEAAEAARNARGGRRP